MLAPLVTCVIVGTGERQQLAAAIWESYNTVHSSCANTTLVRQPLCISSYVHRLRDPYYYYCFFGINTLFLCSGLLAPGIKQGSVGAGGRRRLYRQTGMDSQKKKAARHCGYTVPCSTRANAATRCYTVVENIMTVWKRHQACKKKQKALSRRRQPRGQDDKTRTIAAAAPRGRIYGAAVHVNHTAKNDDSC